MSGFATLTYCVRGVGNRSDHPFANENQINNLHRRHLSETQREVIAAKLANLKHGDVASQKSDGQSCPSTKSTDEAAEQLNVKPRSVKNAKAAIKGGCKELIAAMERAEVTSSLAAKFANLKVGEAGNGRKVGPQNCGPTKSTDEPIGRGNVYNCRQDA